MDCMLLEIMSRREREREGEMSIYLSASLLLDARGAADRSGVLGERFGDPGALLIWRRERARDRGDGLLDAALSDGGRRLGGRAADRRAVAGKARAGE
jgi:hypothetical protein